MLSLTAIKRLYNNFVSVTILMQRSFPVLVKSIDPNSNELLKRLKTIHDEQYIIKTKSPNHQITNILYLNSDVEMDVSTLISRIMVYLLVVILE